MCVPQPISELYVTLATRHAMVTAPASRALLGAAGAAREGLVTYTRLDAASQDAWAALRSSPAQEERPGSSAAAAPGSGPASQLGSGPAAARGRSAVEAHGDPAGSRPKSQHVEFPGTASALQLEAEVPADSSSSRGAEPASPAGRVAAEEQGAAGRAASPGGADPQNPAGRASAPQQAAAGPAASPNSPVSGPGSPEAGVDAAQQGAARPAAPPSSPGAMPRILRGGAGAAQQAATECAGHLSGPGVRSPCDLARVAPSAASAGPRSTARACGKRHARAADGVARGKSATGVVDRAAAAAADPEAAPAAKRQRAALAEDAAGASAACAPALAGCAAGVEGAAAGNPARATALLRSSSAGAAPGAAGGPGGDGRKGSARACGDAAVTVTLNAGPQGLARGTKAPAGGGRVAAAGMPAPRRAVSSVIGRVHASAAVESVPDSVEGEGGGSPAASGGGEQSGDPGACAAEADKEAKPPAKGSPTPVEGAAAGPRLAACPAAASGDQQASPAEGAQAGGERAAALASAPQPAADANRDAACTSGGHAPPQPNACAPATGAAAACGGKACSAALAPGGRAPPSDAEVRELELAASQLHASPYPNPGSLDATAQLPLVPRRHAAAGAAVCGGSARARACAGMGADALPVRAALQAVLADLRQLAPSAAWADREVSHWSAVALTVLQTAICSCL